MRQYLDLLEDVMENGRDKGDRTGTGTRSVFGRTMRFDLKEGFPLVTTKKIHMKSIIHELLWFLNGDTNVKYLQDNGVKIWDDWAIENGDLGPIYGEQWVGWNQGVSPLELLDILDANRGDPDKLELAIRDVIVKNVKGRVNQIQETIDLLKTKPDSRRILVTGWNPSVLPDESLSPKENVRNGKAALPACHTFFQFYTEELTLAERIDIGNERFGMTLGYYENEHHGNAENSHQLLDDWGIPTRRLSCSFYARSQDLFLGTPFNIASYALLTHMVAHCVGMEVGELIWNGGDCHIYSNHVSQVRQQWIRTPFDSPELRIKRQVTSIFDFEYDDFEILHYASHPPIKAPVAY